MEIRIIEGRVDSVACDALAIGFFEGRRRFERAITAVDRKLEGILPRIIQSEHFDGKEGEMRLVHTHGKIPAERLLLMGLGKKSSFSLETIRRVAGMLIKKAREFSPRTIATVIHSAGGRAIEPMQAGRALAEGSLLADYQFLVYQDEKREEREKKHLRQLLLIASDARMKRTLETGTAFGILGVEAAAAARDLVNESPSRTTPAYLARAAQSVADMSENIRVTIFDKKAIAKMNMGGFLGVARGSDEPPNFVHLVYSHPRKNKKKIVFVGKGITFDSGGLSLKPSDVMTTMKLDMAGAAAIIGIFSALPKLAPPLEIHGVFPACENMPSGKAVKPGDILNTMNGKSVEVLNTDAEGRIILADALTYAKNLKPDVLIDFATLTGACVVALGEEVAGLMSNNDELAKRILDASYKSGEKMWRLPLVQEYRELLKSDFADIRNISRTKWGGAITAGLFLQEFTGEQKWAHIDIAGPAWAEREMPYYAVGATGFGVRTAIHFLRDFGMRK